MVKSFILKATSGPSAGKEIKVDSGQLVRVGRAPKAGFATADPYMSGEHFALECSVETCRITDLSSRHGTFLNRERISEAILHEGDEVYVGQTTLIVHIEQGKPTTGHHVAPRSDRKPQQEPSVTERNRSGGIPASKASSTEDNTHRDSTSSLPSTERTATPVREAPRSPAPNKGSASRTSNPIVSPGQESNVQHPTNAALRALEVASAATPEGRLLSILAENKDPLFALLDAARNPGVPELLRGSGEQYQSLYAGDAFAESAPYLAYLSRSSRLLEKLVQEGWGQGWLVYLTCELPLQNIRNYFRESLMIKLPDGREFFSRFYDPRFFRGFLRGCTTAEADRYFGPIRSYLMEAENSEILLQFTKDSKGVQTKERLLLIPGT